MLLHISQDAYQGDAQYTVSVDGKQIGGTLTAHASHAAGQSDTVTVNGDWASGGHTVAVNFLNDAYGGSASLDRNLYVDSATYGGAAVADAHLILGGEGAQNFTFVDRANSAPTSTS
ncbi:carbohydrate-binding domain-containing protein, partial [Methylobacterium mesophilicum]